MGVGKPESAEDFLRRRLLESMSAHGARVHVLAERIGEAEQSVHSALRKLAGDGLVVLTLDRAELTPAGRIEAERLGDGDRSSTPAVSAQANAAASPAAPVDLDDLGRVIGSAWSAAAEHRATQEAQKVAARDAVLASDADRDLATRQLAEAFAQGRLTRGQFEARTTKALSARTHGELDDALQGLGGLKRSAPNHPVRKVVFWVVTVLTSPFMLLGVLLLAFGSDVGDRVGGIFFLGILGPLMFFLRRWAWPRPGIAT